MRTLRSRLILSHILPVLVVVPLMALIGYAILATQGRLTLIESTLDREAQHLTEQAALLAQAAATQEEIWTDSSAAQQFLAGVDAQLSTLVLMNAQGTVVASTVPTDTAHLVELLNREEVTAVLDGQTGFRLQVVELAGAQTAVVLAPVLDANRHLTGMILLSQELSNIQRRMEGIYRLLLVVIVGLLILGILLGSYLALQLETSLRRVTATIQEIAMGQPPDRLPDQETVEIDQLYQAVNTLVQRLNALEEARKRLLANLIHELGRPLGSLRSAVHALRQGAVEDEELRDELLEGMDSQIEGMEPLLDDLTRLHGQVLGSLELNRQPAAFATWLIGHTTLWRESARQKGVIWRADIPLDLPDVEIDVDQMGRALGNLLSNAVKFTPAGGSILVEAGVEDGDNLNTGDFAWIRVGDTGPGIPEEEHERVFSPFQRGETGRRFPQGMGLGLSIARDIARAHGGDIVVDSAPGLGSRFTLTVPVFAENTVVSSPHE